MDDFSGKPGVLDYIRFGAVGPMLMAIGEELGENSTIILCDSPTLVF